MPKIEPIAAGSPETQSADVKGENIAKLRALFPELLTERITEGKTEAVINVDVLKQLVGDATASDAEEKYGLNWHGKRRARQIALTPSTGTLRPCPEESVDWDTTQNLMIEGDNLEVLKLLQKSYAGKVKLIYIDPPYNTGKDFVYPDNFQDSIKNYLELTGQVEGGAKITSNTDASGRFHTDWLNMMYPRLKLARNLLKNDGVVFVSCDDNELPRLRMAMEEIFGEETHLATFIWKSRQNKDNRTVNGASVDHEYLVCFGQSIRGDSRDVTQFSNSDSDARGPWTSANMVGIATADRRPNLHYVLKNPATGVEYACPDMGWRYDKNSMAKLIDDDRILWPATVDGRPRRKAFLNEFDNAYTGFSTIVGNGVFTRHGTAVIEELFSTRVFDFPKPVSLLKTVVEQGCSSGDIVLDFFAGSGTTGHAVIAENAADNGNRRYILVQLPAPLNPENSEQKTASDYCDQIGKRRTIGELTKERLRRAGTKIRTENPLFSGDTGFRVFKLDTSNIRAWNPNRSDLEGSLFANIEHLQPGRSDTDVLYELLLKLGLDLCVPISARQVAGKTVHSIGGGVLMACLEPRIAVNEAEALAQGMAAWRKEQAPAGETTAVFRDSAFENDVAKSNLAAILQQHDFA